MHGRTDGLTKNYSPWESRLTLGIARRGVGRFTCNRGEFRQRFAPASQLVHSPTNTGAVVELRARGDSGGSAGVLDRPKADIAEVVGDMAAKVCECLFEDCHLHASGCSREAKWAARVHAWINPTDTIHHRVFNLCDDCKKRLEAQAIGLIKFGGVTSCTCGMTGKLVSDYIGPVMPL